MTYLQYQQLKPETQALWESTTISVVRMVAGAGRTSRNKGLKLGKPQHLAPGLDLESEEKGTRHKVKEL